MAGGAGAATAAFGFEGEAPVADDFHHTPAFERLKLMLAAVMISYKKMHLFNLHFVVSNSTAAVQKRKNIFLFVVRLRYIYRK